MFLKVSSNLLVFVRPYFTIILILTIIAYGTYKHRDNFLMRKLAKDQSALKINDEKPEAKLLENLSQQNLVDEYENTQIEQQETEEEDESPPSNSIKQNDQKIIPFSEFMKEKVKSGYSIPSKIPAPAKSPEVYEKSSNSKITKPGLRSPKITKMQANNVPVQMDENFALSATMPKSSAKGKYFASLKNKFSPMGDIIQKSDKTSPKIIELGGKKKGTRQPNQQNYYHQKIKEENLTSEGHFVKSEEESKKNIMKVAGKLKKKLKHNFTPTQQFEEIPDADEISDEEVWQPGSKTSAIKSPLAASPNSNRLATTKAKFGNKSPQTFGSAARKTKLKQNAYLQPSSRTRARVLTTVGKYEDLDKKEINVSRKYNFDRDRKYKF